MFAGLATTAGLTSCAGTGAPNDCLIAAVHAQAELPRETWSRLLLVKYRVATVGHAYVVYELPGHQVFAYDSVFGSRMIRPRSLRLLDVLQATDARATFGCYVEEYRTPQR